jgi:DNA-binding winged helix-turn-helix (wHTH) protein
MPRYRFGEFILSPRRRALTRDGRELALIPRYFDLLLFLVERRDSAVHRRDIFDRVWNDVIVSDSALSQAIRTIRRTLGDDPREPRYIRTVSRHGYRFVFDVFEEADEDPVVELPARAGSDDAGEEDTGEGERLSASAGSAIPDTGTATAAPPAEPADLFEPLLARLTRDPFDAFAHEEQREAAELLHALGTDETMRRLGTRPGHTFARALLRDARWDVPAAGPVPIVGQPAAVSVAWALVRLRLRRAARIAAVRWVAAATAAGTGGALAGIVGGLILVAAPWSRSSLSVVPVLALIGALTAAAGGAGVGAGLAAAETTVRSRRALGLVLGSALGGGLVGLAVQWLTRWTLSSILGLNVDTGGAIEGLAIGGAAGLAYAATTPRTEFGLAAPRGRDRRRVIVACALACGVAALILAMAGRPLVGGTLHDIAGHGIRAQPLLTPLAMLIGEPGFGPVTRALLGTGEGAIFGLGLSFGLTRRS